MEKNIKRGQIYWVYLEGKSIGSEQNRTRPCVIIQNDKGNAHAPTTIVAPLGSHLPHRALPTHVYVTPQESGLNRLSVIHFEQIRVVDKSRLMDCVGAVSDHTMQAIDKAIKISLGI